MNSCHREIHLHHGYVKSYSMVSWNNKLSDFCEYLICSNIFDTKYFLSTCRCLESLCSVYLFGFLWTNLHFSICLRRLQRLTENHQTIMQCWSCSRLKMFLVYLMVLTFSFSLLLPTYFLWCLLLLFSSHFLDVMGLSRSVLQVLAMLNILIGRGTSACWPPTLSCCWPC